MKPSRPFAVVALPVPARREFKYSIPDHLLSEKDLVGRRAVVPFGPRKLTGVIVDRTDEPPPVEAKEIAALLDEGPIVGEAILSLTRWIADYYLASWGEALRAALPLGRARQSRRYAVAIEVDADAEAPADGLDAELDGIVRDAGSLPVSVLVRRTGKSEGRVEGALRRLARIGRARIESVLEREEARTKTEAWIEVLPAGCEDGVAAGAAPQRNRPIYPRHPG